LKKVLMAGAPVSGSLIGQVYDLMAPDGQIFTPYGATESLPIVSIEGREVLQETWEKTLDGAGTCVGRALPGIIVKVIESSEQSFTSWSQVKELDPGEIGEIVVKGAVVTRGYENNESEDRFSKIPDLPGFWHRIGDTGYFDDLGRLWFCGRKAHRVHTSAGIMYTIPCEAIVNAHPDIYRSALVGIEGDNEYGIPVMIVEKEKESKIDEIQLLAEVKQISKRHPLTTSIDLFLIHPSFPVDIRHNAKIFREKLKKWAQVKIG
jgi:acyl-CoA synthetase (AMP-forming)/AMP-acid ligase II